MIFERLLDTRLIWDRSRLLLLFDLGRPIGFRRVYRVDAFVYCTDMLTLGSKSNDTLIHIC